MSHVYWYTLHIYSPGILGIFKGKDGKKKYKAENFRSYLDGHPE